MQPLRKNVAIAIDGGGIRGIIVTRALAMLEEYLGRRIHDISRLAAGTSTGSIISAGLAAGLSAREMDNLYAELGGVVFSKTARTTFFPLTRYRYHPAPLEDMLRLYLGAGCLGDFWSAPTATDVVITTFDLAANRTRFLKPWKEEYRAWTVVKAVLASCTVPTYFPPVEGRYIDGGVGAYANPAYLAAYELQFCLGWDPLETTLISLGTGRVPHVFQPADAGRMYAWHWLAPILGAFMQSADDQQVHLVDTFFKGLDFRRFQVDLRESIAMDDPAHLAALQSYGEELGLKLLNDQCDRAMNIRPLLAPGAGSFRSGLGHHTA